MTKCGCCCGSESKAAAAALGTLVNPTPHALLVQN